MHVLKSTVKLLWFILLADLDEKEIFSHPRSLLQNEKQASLRKKVYKFPLPQEEKLFFVHILLKVYIYLIYPLYLISINVLFKIWQDEQCKQKGHLLFARALNYD